MESNNAPFAVGQKVVCISDSFTNHWEFSNSPIRKDGVYTVYHIEYYPQFRKWYIKLQEDTDPFANYWANRFAPVQTQYTDITKELCDSVGITEEVPDVKKIKELEPSQN